MTQPDCHSSHLPTLPTRLRNGSKSVTSRPHSSTSTQTIPAPSTGTPPWNASAEGRSGSLHAFFKATDYTPSSQSLPLTKLDGSVLECEHEDDIEDDSVDEIFENLPDTQGTTRFMLDRRKRSTPTQGHRTFKPSQRVPSASQRLLVHECDAIPETSKVAPTQADSRPWADRFGPARLEELAVHKKKVLDVQRWLKDAWQAGSPKVETVSQELRRVSKADCSVEAADPQRAFWSRENIYCHSFGKSNGR